MNARNILLKQITIVKTEIINLEKQLISLQIEEIQINDNKQKYKEVYEVVGGKGAIVGRVYWNENFVDEHTEEIIIINRSRIVKVGEAWYINDK